jgi:hypothetical protein
MCWQTKNLSNLKVLSSEMDPAEIGLISTRIGKCETKKFGINCQLWIKLYLIVIFHFSLVKIAMNAPRLCKLCKDYLTGIGQGAMVLSKCLQFFIF